MSKLYVCLYMYVNMCVYVECVKNMILLAHYAKINSYIYSFNHSTNSVYNVPVALLHIMMCKLHTLISSNSDSKYQYEESKKQRL